MPISPTNCYICRKPWYGKGPLCNSCTAHSAPQHSVFCSYCGSKTHVEADCLDAQLAAQHRATLSAIQYSYISAQAQARLATMARRNTRRSKPYTNFYDSPEAPLKKCVKCHQNAQIETKAGSVCTNCKNIVRNPCRNCNSHETHGIGGDGTQFIECNDCQFIE